MQLKTTLSNSIRYCFGTSCSIKAISPHCYFVIPQYCHYEGILIICFVTILHWLISYGNNRRGISLYMYLLTCFQIFSSLLFSPFSHLLFSQQSPLILSFSLSSLFATLLCLNRLIEQHMNSLKRSLMFPLTKH